MPTGHTQVTIYNTALDIVSTRPVSSLSESSVECRWLNRNFEHYVRSALRSDLWNFSLEMHELNRQVDKPAFRWNWGFDLPVGWLRVVPPRYGGVRTGRPIKYAVASGTLLTDHESVKADIVMDRQNPGEWDPLFADYLAAKLAYGLSHSLTHKASFKAETKQAVQDAYDIAAAVNAFESPVEDIEQHDVLRVRYE
jgi:hypothetical protein